MALSNPAFSNTPAFAQKSRGPVAPSATELDELYGRPSATPSDTDRDRRRADLDHDLIAIAAMLAILVLACLCFVAQSHLPF